MIETVKETVEQEVVSGIICSKCKTKITPDNFIEWQERVSFSDVGGFGSMFGDCQKWRVDFCQKCAFELFSEYIEYDDSDDDESVV